MHRLLQRPLPRKVTTLAGYREFGAYVESDRRTPLLVWVLCAVIGWYFIIFPVGLVVRLCLGLWDERTAALVPHALAGPLLLVCGYRFGWYRGVLYRFEGGVVLRRYRSCRAWSWAELTAETHGYWSEEGDKFEFKVWREELELRTRDGRTVYRFDHHPREVSERVRSAAAREPQDSSGA